MLWILSESACCPSTADVSKFYKEMQYCNLCKTRGEGRGVGLTRARFFFVTDFFPLFFWSMKKRFPKLIALDVTFENNNNNNNNGDIF